MRGQVTASSLKAKQQLDELTRTLTAHLEPGASCRAQGKGAKCARGGAQGPRRCNSDGRRGCARIERAQQRRLDAPRRGPRQPHTGRRRAAHTVQARRGEHRPRHHRRTRSRLCGHHHRQGWPGHDAHHSLTLILTSPSPPPTPTPTPSPSLSPRSALALRARRSRQVARSSPRPPTPPPTLLRS